jgi:hypothetical protein
VAVKAVVVVRLALFWFDGFACLVMGVLFVLLVKGMLLVVVKAEYGWLWHSGKTSNRTEVSLDICLGALAMDNMGDVMAANTLCD